MENRVSPDNDLVREVKEAKEWLGSVGFLVSPEFLDADMNAVPEPTASRGPSKEPEVVGDAAKEPRVKGDSMREPENLARAAEPFAGPPGQLATVQPMRTNRWPMILSSEDEGENTPNTEEGSEGMRSESYARDHRNRANSCPWLQGSGECTEYVAKDEKDGQEPEVKERGSRGKSKGKAKEKGSTTGPSSISSKGVLDTSEGTRMSTLAGEERMEDSATLSAPPIFPTFRPLFYSLVLSTLLLGPTGPASSFIKITYPVTLVHSESSKTSVSPPSIFRLPPQFRLKS
ncbi:hypothetical protein JB92DRAFT_3125703 [Gautieria morchelliformis]|nr:hypothetical protein JB92DRAFT_3125703 [Gautieria morchelliformis]